VGFEREEVWRRREEDEELERRDRDGEGEYEGRLSLYSRCSSSLSPLLYRRAGRSAIL
jgi:hypothetical protein